MNKYNTLLTTIALDLCARSSEKVHDWLKDYLQKKEKEELIEMLCDFIWEKMEWKLKEKEHEEES